MSHSLLSFISAPQKAVDNTSKLVINPEHDEPMGSWSSQQIRDATTSSTMLTWAPGKARHGTPIITHGEGVYLFDDQVRKMQIMFPVVAERKIHFGLHKAHGFYFLGKQIH